MLALFDLWHDQEIVEMSIFGSILKTVIDTATLPIEVAKDVVTLGGVVTGEHQTYTDKRLEKLSDDLEDISDDAGDL